MFAWDGEDFALFDVEAILRGSTQAVLLACAFTFADGRIETMAIDVRAIRPAVHGYPVYQVQPSIDRMARDRG